MKPRPGEQEARAVITAMLVLTVIIVIFVAALSALSLSVKSLILIVWMAVMMAVLRRYRT